MHDDPHVRKALSERFQDRWHERRRQRVRDGHTQHLSPFTTDIFGRIPSLYTHKVFFDNCEESQSVLCGGKRP